MGGATVSEPLAGGRPADDVEPVVVAEAVVLEARALVVLEEPNDPQPSARTATAVTAARAVSALIRTTGLPVRRYPTR